MAAWVIREERQGEPQGRLPARGDRGTRAGRVRGDRARDGRGRELQQRLGGARQAGVGVALRRPPGVRAPHRRLGRLGRRLEGRRRASRAGSPATRSSIHCNHGLLRGPRGPRPRPARGAVARRSGATRPPGARSPSSRKVQAQQLLPKPTAPDLGGGRLLRARLLHRLPHADRPVRAAGRPPRADLGRRRRPRRVRHAALRARRRRTRSASSPRAEKGELVKQLGAVRLHRPQRVRRHDAQGRRDARGGEGALQGRRARSRKRVKEILGDAARHRLRARRPGDVPDLGVHGQAVRQGRDLRAAPPGYKLDFDVRYLWMRQKQIIGSHFANA